MLCILHEWPSGKDPLPGGRSTLPPVRWEAWLEHYSHVTCDYWGVANTATGPESFCFVVVEMLAGPDGRWPKPLPR